MNPTVEISLYFSMHMHIMLIIIELNGSRIISTGFYTLQPIILPKDTGTPKLTWWEMKGQKSECFISVFFLASHMFSMHKQNNNKF
jgi:hypothetical protein